MKFLLALLCSLLAFTVATEQDDCQIIIDNLSAPEAECNAETTLLCHDPCNYFTDEPLNVTLEQCANDIPYCCVSDGKCIMKNNPALRINESSFDPNDLAKELQALQPTISVEVTTAAAESTTPEDDGSRSGNIFGPGPGSFPSNPYNPYGSRLPFCPKFPQTCAIPQGIHVYTALKPPINIPYCQRNACSSSNPFLERDEHRCITHPGCYFDRELSQYRKLVGQTVLPGVPVCHRVIRNRAFLAHAEQTKTQLNGVWNPLLTQCLLDEYKKDIFGPHVGCQFLDMLSFFGHPGKHAGWQGINPRECALIGACWKKGDCIYPVNRQGQPTVYSCNNKPGNRQLSANLFGQPVCRPFDDSTVDKFLSSYHLCLSTGCASIVDRKTLQDKLIEAGRQAFGPSYSPAFHQYLQKVYSGEARPDNYRKVIQRLKNPIFPGLFSFSPVLPNFPHLPGPLIISFSLESNASGSRSFELGGAGQGNGGYPPSGGVFPFPPVYPPPPPPNQCPYNQQNYRYPGVKPLTGSFSGCCRKPICYLPKTDLYNHPSSGISAYLSQWSYWTDCTVSCGRGERNRTRKCIGAYCDPNNPGGLIIQTRTCNAHPCPRYGPWSRWTPCSKTCGGGVTERERACLGKGKCQGPSEETRPCRTGVCPTFTYTSWSKCSSTCGIGIRTRTRRCINGGAYGCPPGRQDQSPCQHFVGSLVDKCDESTCCYTTECLRFDGSPGCCASKTTSITRTRCFQGACSFNYYAQCSSLPDLINPFSLNLDE